MSRTTNQVLFACTAVMLAVAAGVVALRWETFGHLAELSGRARNGPIFGLTGILFCPAWVVTGAVMLRRQLARTDLRMADDRRQHTEFSFMAAAVLVVGGQLVMASSFVLPELRGPGGLGEFGVRAFEALTGVFLVVTANFAAKTSPPTGERAPDPGVWTRSLLRTSWISVLAGAVIVAAAVLAELSVFPWIIMAAALATLAGGLLHKRALRSV